MYSVTHPVTVTVEAVLCELTSCVPDREGRSGHFLGGAIQSVRCSQSEPGSALSASRMHVPASAAGADFRSLATGMAW